MGYVELDAVHTYVGTGGAHAPIIYLIDSPDHPFDVAPLAQGRTCTIVTVPVASWNEALTPWPAAGLYREEPDFGGKAADTLDELLCIAIPAIEQQTGLSPTHRALGGYSLGGLFSLYAFTHCDAFCACACLSGSVWYEGWVDHLRGLDLALPISPSAPRKSAAHGPSCARSRTTWAHVPKSYVVEDATYVLSWDPATTCSTFPSATTRDSRH